MSAEKIFYIVFMILFIWYIFNRYMVTQKISLLLVLFGQFFSLIMNLILVFNNTRPNFTVQFITSTFGIVIPGMIFFNHYFYNNKKFNAQEKAKKIFTVIKSFTAPKTENPILLGDGSSDELGLAKEVSLITEKHVEDLLKGYNLPIDEIPSSVKNALGQIDKLLMTKSYRKALEICLSVEKQCTDNAVLQYNIGNMYYYLKDYDNAIERYDTALYINGGFEKVGHNRNDRASHTIAARRIKNSLKRVQDYEIAVNMAVAFLAKGKYEKAIDLFKKAGKYKGDNWVDIYKPMAIIYEKLGKYAEAVEMYKNLCEFYPEDFEYLKKTAQLLSELGDYTQSKLYYDKIVGFKPDYSDGYIRLGNLLLEKEMYSEAVEMYNEAIKIKPKESVIYYNLGIALYGRGDKVGALSEYKHAIEMNENDYKSYYNLGMILDELDRKQDAVLAFEHCLDIKPDFYEASNNMAVVLCTLERYEEAIDTYIKALQFSPSNHELYFNLAVTLECKGQNEHAEELYKKIIKLKPDFTEAYYNLAMILCTKGELASAEECFRKTIEYDANCHKAYYQLSRIHAANREYARCLDNLKKAISLSRDYINKAQDEKLFDNVRTLNGYRSIVEV